MSATHVPNNQGQVSQYSTSVQTPSASSELQKIRISEITPLFHYFTCPCTHGSAFHSSTVTETATSVTETVVE
ncbi:unnamed protein product [Orchesella dallaii]|uniref:Uncharacterized protein n=1 Tax=Orchesella dallaii TaxID=48710 RepID=A0ABP1QZZ9_9HEXA